MINILKYHNKYINILLVFTDSIDNHYMECFYEEFIFF